MLFLVLISCYVLSCVGKVDEKTMETVKQKINLYSVNNTNPFLKHIQYFESDDQIITYLSIGNQWKKLSNEVISPFVKSFITIQAAEVKGLCPYAGGYDKEYIMHTLKHPSDSGIVVRDGSINEAELLKFIEKAFVYDDNKGKYVLWQSTMNTFIKSFAERDVNQNNYVSWYLPTFDTVAQAEWDDFFLNFSDLARNDDKGIFIDTLLEFYYASDVLYERTLKRGHIEL